MVLDLKSTKDYLNILYELSHNDNVPHVIVDKLKDYVWSIEREDGENEYSKPMLWIGMYITLASLYCILAMVADLVHGLRSRKLWFPCKYFTINAFSLTVISVAMKLPVDLSGMMPSPVDQAAKLGSMAFMCTMMTNLLPCLATMDINALLANITALGVLVITLVVNICIQIYTGVITVGSDWPDHLVDTFSKAFPDSTITPVNIPYPKIATIYVTLLLVLLIMHVCSSLAIIKSKQNIELHYHQSHETASKHLQQSTTKFLTVDELQQHVSNYWMMAGSGNPQFIIACFVTTTASGVICSLTSILHALIMYWTVSFSLKDAFDTGSDYKWSMKVILIVQSLGILLGTISPLFRCFASLSFKMSIKSILNHMKVFKVESYWTQKLYDWKHGGIRIPFRSRKLKVVIKNLESLILNLCIKLQEGVVVVCKIIALIPFFFMICVMYCLHCLKWLLQTVISSSEQTTGNMEQNLYVLEHENGMELAERTLEGLTKSLNRLIQKGEKKKPNNLKKLIQEKSTKGFQGVKKFDNNDHHIHCSSSIEEYRNCWSLPVVTLTTVAVTLPNIEKVEIESLMKSVTEGLEYVTLVEENLNATADYVSIHKAAKTLWQEVEVCHTWLGEELEDIASQVNIDTCQVDTTRQIVQLFLEKAKYKINEGVGCTDDDSKFTSICVNSMYRITETIIAENESHNRLFDELSSRIADIMAACLTNLPRVIAMKCHTSVIENREACVEAAARLLGETKGIIITLEDCDVPSMNVDDLPFIDKWRAYLSDP